jgi:hypothetical protein
VEPAEVKQTPAAVPKKEERFMEDGSDDEYENRILAMNKKTLGKDSEDGDVDLIDKDG